MRDSYSQDPQALRAAFEAAAIPFMKSVYNGALRLTRRREDASDLVQETYLRAYRNFASFTPGTNCKAWLFTILYSIFINRYRRQKREPESVPVEELDERFHRALQTASVAQETWLAQAKDLKWEAPEVDRAVASLAEIFRNAIVLVDLEGLTYEEAAAVLNCPVGTLRSRLFRARKFLFLALEDYARRKGYI